MVQERKMERKKNTVRMGFYVILVFFPIRLSSIIM
jgi:hypothetical protein